MNIPKRVELIDRDELISKLIDKGLLGRKVIDIIDEQPVVAVASFEMKIEMIITE